VQEIGMETWAVRTGMEIFAGHGRAKTFVMEVKANPTGHIFPDDEEFVRWSNQNCPLMGHRNPDQGMI
jgi:hypothetical protein